MVDYGAGMASKREHHNHRRISKIAQRSLTPVKYSLLLRNMIEYLNIETIVELGTSLGVNTAYLASAKTNPLVYSFEGNPSLIAYAGKMHRNIGFKENVYLIEGNITETLKNNIPSSVDLAYVDANHTFQATLDYFYLIEKRCHQGSVIIFDDIYWSKEMTKAWKQIKSNERVTLSIDLFKFGIVFFDPTLHKENWIIDY